MEHLHSSWPLSGECVYLMCLLEGTQRNLEPRKPNMIWSLVSDMGPQWSTHEPTIWHDLTLNRPILGLPHCLMVVHLFWLAPSTRNVCEEGISKIENVFNIFNHNHQPATVCFASQSISRFQEEKKLENQLARARSVLFSVHGEIRWYKCWKFQKCSRKTQNTAVIAVYVPCCGAKSHPNLCLGTFYRLRSPLRLTQSDWPGSNGWPTWPRDSHWLRTNMERMGSTL